MSAAVSLIQTAPQRANFSNEIDFARAMQRWALDEVPSNNPQRLICINDWFLEELLLLNSKSGDSF
jgi:hypothetical protein